MSEQDLRTQERFSEFVNSSDYGGPTDIFSVKKLIDVKKKSERLNTTKKADLIDTELKNLDDIKKQLEEEFAKIRDRDQTSNENGKPFNNRFPYGKSDLLVSPPKLESILLTSALNMDNSSKDFSRLCKTLFPDTYGEMDEESKILMDFFGSIADYPYINPKSQGLLSIANLYQLFEEFYMSYDSKEKIDQTAFFTRFLEISSLDIRNKNSPYQIPRFEQEINDIYVFNPELWWNIDDNGFFKKDFGNKKNAFKSNPVSDSYGAFFEAPVLCNIFDMSSDATSRIRTFQQSTEIDLRPDGVYDTKLNSTFMLSNESKVFCLLFQKSVKTGTNEEFEILGEYDYNKLSPNGDANKLPLTLLYNAHFNKIQYPTSSKTEPKNKYAFYIQKTRNYYDDQNTNTLQTGGRKKNAKGGTMDNIFDTKSLPNLLAKRIGKPFNPELFVESLKKYQSERLRFSDDILKVLLKKIKDEAFLPLILDNAKKSYGQEKLKYEELRHLFLWSSVYTTYKKLLAHFFRNIFACYLYYKTLIDPFYKNKSFDKQNQLVPLFMLMNTNIENLLVEIKKTFLLLEKNLIVNGQDTNVKNLFAGFDVMNPGESSSSSSKQIFPNIIEDKFFKDYCLMALIPDHFKSFMQLFSLKFGIILGGIPIVLSEYLEFIKNLPVCFQFFLQYRIITNNYLKDKLTLFKKEIKEQQSPAEIQAIIKEVDIEIERMFKNTKNLKLPFLIDNYRKYIEFILSFGMKNFIKILNKIIRNLSKKGTGQYKNKGIRLDSPENTNLIGHFKEEINYFMQKLRDKGDLPENLYLFIFGKLFNFIYRLDILLNFNKEISGESFKLLIEGIGIKLSWTENNIIEWAKHTTKILTTPELQKTVKTRWLGLKSAINTSNAAKKELSDIFYNPAIYTPDFWSKVESKFLSENSNKKLFIIAVEIGKLQKNAYLIDPFAVAQSIEPKPVIRNNIKTTEEIDNNGVIQKEYYDSSNQIIELKNFSIFKGDFQTGFKKWVSKEFAKGLQKEEFGRAFAEYAGIRRNKKDRGFHQTELMKRLLLDELERYVVGNNKKTTKLRTCFLMGYDRNQLQAILQKNVFNLPKNKRFASNTTSYDDYQLYLIKSDELQHIQRFRLWLWKLLMSKPLFFNKEYMNPGQIPLSDFSQLQVPFGKLFIKTGEWGLSSYLLEYLKEITKTMKDKYNTSKNKNTAANLKSLLRFVPMIRITPLELLKTNVVPELKINSSKTVNSIVESDFANAAAGVSGISGTGLWSASSAFGAHGFGIGSRYVAPESGASRFDTSFEPVSRAPHGFGTFGTGALRFRASPRSEVLLTNEASRFSLPPINSIPTDARSLRPASARYVAPESEASLRFGAASVNLRASTLTTLAQNKPETFYKHIDTNPIIRMLFNKFQSGNKFFKGIFQQLKHVDNQNKSPTYIYTFFGKNNDITFQLKVSFNGQNFRYSCRNSASSMFFELNNDEDNTNVFFSTDSNRFFSINISTKQVTILNPPKYFLDWTEGKYYYWEELSKSRRLGASSSSAFSPKLRNSANVGAIETSALNASLPLSNRQNSDQKKIQAATSTDFYSSWCAHVIDHCKKDNQYLNIEPKVRSQLVTLFEFKNSTKMLVTIYYNTSNRKNYIYFSETIGQVLQGEIEYDSSKYIAKWAPGGRSSTSIEFTFNQKCDRLLTYTFLERTYNLTLTDNGYIFTDEK